jgi:hypothetical protein
LGKALVLEIRYASSNLAGPIGEETMVKQKFWIRGPRGCGLLKALKKLEFETGTDLTVNIIDKGWFRVTICGAVEGPRESVAAFTDAVKRGVERLNMGTMED